MNAAEISQPQPTAVRYMRMKQGIFLAAALLLLATAADARPVKIVRNSAMMEFSYQWPSEAAAIPVLDRRFRAEAAKEYRRHLKLGVEDKKLYRQQQRGSVTDFYSKTWSTAGETPRLLSLQYKHATYTGGAHPNTDYGALLWDRKLDRPIPVVALFRQSAAFANLTRAPYCRSLNQERQNRRGGEKINLPDFKACPKYADLAIAPADKNKDGRFDTIAFIASPYTAGPYVEGEYDTSVPVTSQLIAAIKPEYRSSFARQRQ
jgi:hypothetical protein